MNWVLALSLMVAGAAVAAAGIYVGHMDDAPGAALIGILIMAGAWAFGGRLVWRRR